jgi:hypothetical protein
VDHLEHHIGAQRERLRDAAVSLQDLVERVPGGLGEMRRPLLSASADSTLSAPRPGEQPPAPPVVENGVAGKAEAERTQALPQPEALSSDAPAPYEFPALMDPTPRETSIATSGAGDETLAMRLDLGSVGRGSLDTGSRDMGSRDTGSRDVDTATTPMWSTVGDDPLIVGDELQ